MAFGASRLIVTWPDDVGVNAQTRSSPSKYRADPHAAVLVGVRSLVCPQVVPEPELNGRDATFVNPVPSNEAHVGAADETIETLSMQPGGWSLVAPSFTQEKTSLWVVPAKLHGKLITAFCHVLLLKLYSVPICPDVICVPAVTVVVAGTTYTFTKSKPASPSAFQLKERVTFGCPTGMVKSLKK